LKHLCTSSMKTISECFITVSLFRRLRNDKVFVARWKDVVSCKVEFVFLLLIIKNAMMEIVSWILSGFIISSKVLFLLLYLFVWSTKIAIKKVVTKQLVVNRKPLGSPRHKGKVEDKFDTRENKVIAWGWVRWRIVTAGGVLVTR